MAQRCIGYPTDTARASIGSHDGMHSRAAHTLPAGILSPAAVPRKLSARASRRAEYSPDKPFSGTSRRFACSRIAVPPYCAAERVRERRSHGVPPEWFAAGAAKFWPRFVSINFPRPSSCRVCVCAFVRACVRACVCMRACVCVRARVRTRAFDTGVTRHRIRASCSSCWSCSLELWFSLSAKLADEK